MDQNSVLPFERHDVGHRAERDEIELSLEIEVQQGPPLEQGMTDFEDDPDAAEITKRAFVGDFRIHHRDAFGQGGFRFVMIENDDVRATLLSSATSAERKCRNPPRSRSCG